MKISHLRTLLLSNCSPLPIPLEQPCLDPCHSLTGFPFTGTLCTRSLGSPLWILLSKISKCHGAFASFTQVPKSSVVSGRGAVPVELRSCAAKGKGKGLSPPQLPWQMASLASTYLEISPKSKG